MTPTLEMWLSLFALVFAAYSVGYGMGKKSSKP